MAIKKNRPFQFTPIKRNLIEKWKIIYVSRSLSDMVDYPPVVIRLLVVYFLLRLCNVGGD